MSKQIWRLTIRSAAALSEEVVKVKATEVKRMASQAIDELAMALDDGYSESLKLHLAMLGRFHRYSIGNVILIGLQRPDATRVAGYRTWQQLGRQVGSSRTPLEAEGHEPAPVVQEVVEGTGESGAHTIVGTVAAGTSCAAGWSPRTSFDWTRIRGECCLLCRGGPVPRVWFRRQYR